MFVKGIGQVKKEELLEVLTSEGREAVKNGEMTMEEVASEYKCSKVKKCARCGSFAATFENNFYRIPLELREKLTSEELGALADAFCDCYNDGRENPKTEE